MRPGLTEIAALILRESGIRLKDVQLGGLEASVRRASGGMDAIRFLELAADPLEGPAAVRALIDEVTVNETSFLRDRRQLEAIPWSELLLRARADGAPSIRIWSVGCATGEEAYSLALLAAEAFGAEDTPVRVLGTDISQRALAAARAGVYRGRALRALGTDLRAGYFREEDGRLAVGERIRASVTFLRHNLARDPIPPLGEAPFDLVVCRNVLIYFDGDVVGRVLDGLEEALRPGGTLILGAADALCATARRLARLPVARVDSAARRPRPEPRQLRRPLGRRGATSEEDLAGVLRAADHGRSGEAISAIADVLASDPLNVDAYFVRGLVQLEAGDVRAATSSLERARALDPSFALAAFALGRAYDAVGDVDEARGAYQDALRTLDPDGGRLDYALEQVDVGDIATACRARIAALAPGNAA